MTAGPDGFRDPVPNSTAASGSRDSNRVLWIFGSTDRHLVLLFHPGINALELERALPPSRVVRDPVPVRAISCSIPAEAAWRFGRLQLAEIEIADRLRGGALLQVDGQALQPNGVLGLQGGECSDCIVPMLSATTMLGQTAVRTTGVPMARAARYRA